MQIHEITKSQLDEGLLDLAKGAAGAIGRGAAAVGRAGSAVASPFKAIKGAYQQGAGTSNTQLIANKAAGVWNKYAQTLKASTPDPARYATLYRQTLMSFVQKNLLGGQPITSAVNKQEITQLIDAIVAAAANPQQVTQLFSKLVQQASVSQQDVTSSALVKVVSTNPTVIQYRTVDYAQNANGDWANQKTNKVPDESFQAFLDTEARRAGA